MRRPVTWLLLLLFAVAELYPVRANTRPAAAVSQWVTVSAEAGGLLSRDGRYYLVTPSTIQELRPGAETVRAVSAATVSWMDVPEPSGQGVWRVALGPRHRPLAGVGGPVFISPDGHSVLWLDPGTGTLYFSKSPLDRLGPGPGGIQSVASVRWDPDGVAAAIRGVGAQGAGIYLWKPGGLTVPAYVPGGGTAISDFTLGRQGALLVATAGGGVVWPGREPVSLPAFSTLALAHDHAALLGLTPERVVLWHRGVVFSGPRPDLKWEGAVRFSADGNRAAVLARSSLGTPYLLVYAKTGAAKIPVPFGSGQLIGFAGNQWVLMTVAGAGHHGVYAYHL